MTTPTDTLIDWLTGRDADEGEVIAALGTAWAGPPLGQVRERAPRLEDALDELDDLVMPKGVSS
jgi:hypothetical protein